MNKIYNQKRYSDEFKRKVLEEFKQGKWATPYAVAKAYNIRPITIAKWIDDAGLSHLRGRTIEIKTLSEVSELRRLRAENRKLRNHLIDEIIARREDTQVLLSASKEFSFDIVAFRNKVIAPICTES